MTYNWIFNDQSFQCAKSLDKLKNVVECIHWQYESTDGTTSGVITGCNGFSAPTSKDFIPFEDLTQAEVISWLEAANDMEQLNAAADHEYNQVKNAGNQEVLPPPFAITENN
jgi:hypothetical protein